MFSVGARLRGALEVGISSSASGSHADPRIAAIGETMDSAPRGEFWPVFGAGEDPRVEGWDASAVGCVYLYFWIDPRILCLRKQFTPSQGPDSRHIFLPPRYRLFYPFIVADDVSPETYHLCFVSWVDADPFKLFFLDRFPLNYSCSMEIQLSNLAKQLLCWIRLEGVAT